MFQEFLSELQIDNSANISSKYKEITASLNNKFRDTDSKTANRLQVGSYGRYTGIKGISDLDMLYIMPANKWDDYKGNKQSQLLNDTRDAIKSRYPNTAVKVDRLVVQVLFTNFQVEVQPVFEQDDESFKYPDTYDGGNWKITKPRAEIAAMKEFVDQKNSNLRKLCKMARAWKNKHGVAMGGLLIDTLAYNFLKSTDDYDDKGYSHYDWLSRDFFKYLSDENDKEYYLALGSRQQVKVRSKFQKKTVEAYELCLKAIESGDSGAAHAKWKKVYGKPFPAKPTEMTEAASSSRAATSWDNTEQFIEDQYPIDIRYSLNIDCKVSQNGYRDYFLRKIIQMGMPLQTRKKLLFTINNISVPEPYSIKWKVLNRGDVAERRNCIRGRILSDGGYHQQQESTDFNGEHIVECYVIKNGVVVAKDRIDVPITGET